MTVRARFRHCPECGEQRAISDDTREFHCQRCTYRYFHNVAAAVAAFVVHDGALLATRRAASPARDTLDLPGGFVEPGESAEQALTRELGEELGLDTLPAPPRYLFSLPNDYPYDAVTYATCDLFYALDCMARPLVCPGAEIAAIEWLDLAALDPTQFGLASIRLAVQHYRLQERVKDAAGASETLY